MGQFATGQAVPRTEDPRLLRGEGRFVDDIRLAGDPRCVNQIGSDTEMRKDRKGGFETRPYIHRSG